MGMPESSLIVRTCATEGLAAPEHQLEIVLTSTPKYSANSDLDLPVLTIAAFNVTLNFSTFSPPFFVFRFASAETILIHLNSIVNT